MLLDILQNGASEFKGVHIHFGSEKLENWSSILLHLCKKENIAIPHQLIYRKKQELFSQTLQKDLQNYIYLVQQKLHQELFPEEYDFIYDSLLDANDRKNNKNPMSQKYIDETNLRRRTMGVSELGKNGEPKDTSSKDYCKEMIKNNLKPY